MISLLWPSPLKARVIEDIGINEPQLLAIDDFSQRF